MAAVNTFLQMQYMVKAEVAKSKQRLYDDLYARLGSKGRRSGLAQLGSVSSRLG